MHCNWKAESHWQPNQEFGGCWVALPAEISQFPEILTPDDKCLRCEKTMWHLSKSIVTITQKISLYNSRETWSTSPGPRHAQMSMISTVKWFKKHFIIHRTSRFRDRLSIFRPFDLTCTYQRFLKFVKQAYFRQWINQCWSCYKGVTTINFVYLGYQIRMHSTIKVIGLQR